MPRRIYYTAAALDDIEQMRRWKASRAPDEPRRNALVA